MPPCDSKWGEVSLNHAGKHCGKRRLTCLHGVVKVAVTSERGEGCRYEVSQVLLGVRPGSNLLCSLSFFLWVK